MEDGLGVVEVLEDVEELLHPRRILALELRKSGRLALWAEGANGKTQLVRGLASGLGVEPAVLVVHARQQRTQHTRQGWRERQIRRPDLQWDEVVGEGEPELDATDLRVGAPIGRPSRRQQ